MKIYQCPNCNQFNNEHNMRQFCGGVFSHAVSIGDNCIKLSTKYDYKLAHPTQSGLYFVWKGNVKVLACYVYGSFKNFVVFKNDAFTKFDCHDNEVTHWAPIE